MKQYKTLDMNDGRGGEHIQTHARPRWIISTFQISYLLNLASSTANVLWLPDPLALTLIYWTIHHPRHVGMTIAFICGLLMDVQNGSVLGQQALAYSRHRKTKGYDNAGRERAQQRIIKAIINKLISANGLTKVNDLMDIAPNYIITNMPAEKIADFVSGELNELKPWTISSITSDNGVYEDLYVASLDPSLGVSNVYLFSRDEVHAVVNAYDAARRQLQMNSFTFNLNDLYANTPKINTSENIRYADMAENPQ